MSEFSDNINKIVAAIGGDDDDVSDWMDSMGCCKMCGGEIPGGHQSNCYVYTTEKRIKELEQWNADMVAKAAEGGTLDGYREMGEKLAAAEKTINRLHDNCKVLAAEVAQLKEWSPWDD